MQRNPEQLTVAAVLPFVLALSTAWPAQAQENVISGVQKLLLV
jgi:hypothetical protein